MANAAFAAAQYRDLDLNARVAVASPHLLVAMLFDALRSSLQAAERAVTAGIAVARVRTVTRALSILDALENSLDFAAGPVARTLATLYGELRALVVAGNSEGAPELLATAAARVATLAEAWRSAAPVSARGRG